MIKKNSNLKKNGYDVFSINNIEEIKNYFCQFIKNKFEIKNLDEIRKEKKIETINTIRSQLIPELSDLIFNSIKKNIKNYFIESVYLIQRYPHIAINHAKDVHSKTLMHSDVYTGHSPFTYTIWIPLHNITDNSGIYILDLKDSLKKIDNLKYDNKNTINFINNKRIFPKFKYGECIIFNGFNLHGSEMHNNPLSRVALNVRINPANVPLMERDSYYFKFFKL